MTPGKPRSRSLASPSASDRDISLPGVPAPDHDPAGDLWATPKLPVFPMPPPQLTLNLSLPRRPLLSSLTSCPPTPASLPEPGVGGGHGSCPIALTSGWRLSRDVTLLLVPCPAVPAAGHVWLPRPDHGCPQTSRLPRVSPALLALAGPLSCPQTLAAPRDTPRVSAGRQGLCGWPTSSCSLIVVS